MEPEKNNNFIDLDVNFINDNGKICDFVIFRDIEGNVLGITMMNDKTFELPDNTMFCDYYHQSFGTNKFTSRIILGTKIKEDNNELIVEMTNKDTTRQINAKENIDYVVIANNKEDLITQIVNETMRNMDTPEEENDIQINKIAV